MLTVVAVALAIVVAALVLANMIGVRRRAVGFVGIHVPHDAVAFVVGAPKSIRSGGIRNGSVALDDVVQGHFQLIAAQTVGGIVVVGGLG